MSKKSEHNAQVRKQRIGQPLKDPKRADGTGASDEKRGLAQGGAPGKPLPRWLARTIKGVALLAALSCLSGILSFLFPPSVPVTSPILGTLVPPVEIMNQSLLPIHNVSYGCELAFVVDQSGFAVSPNAGAPSPQKSKSFFPGRQKTPVECQGQIDLRGVRIKSTEYHVSISYFHAGWPFRRHTEYRVKGAFDMQGNLLHWIVE
jgi:hypothetical protein